VSELSPAEQLRYDNSPDNWIPHMVPVGDDVYVQVDPHRVHLITYYHWCHREHQWKGSTSANTVLMIGDLLTLEKELFLGSCCSRRGRVSSGSYREI
jgi:hypothetical protein